MADQGQWFKLWVSALHDPDLANLPLEHFARWAILGAYIKAHGTNGQITLRAPARALCALFHVPDFDALHVVFHCLPNVTISNVSSETYLTVSFSNWSKYQGDYSTARVRRFREMKRSKRRGEERRREEKRSTPPDPPPNSGNGAGTGGPFVVPAVIQETLRRAPRMSVVTSPTFWLAELRANPGVDYPAEILKAEAWLAANPRKPRKNLAKFLHNWLAGADREEPEP